MYLTRINGLFQVWMMTKYKSSPSSASFEVSSVKFNLRVCNCWYKPHHQLLGKRKRCVSCVFQYKILPTALPTPDAAALQFTTVVYGSSDDVSATRRKFTSCGSCGCRPPLQSHTLRRYLMDVTASTFLQTAAICR